VFETPLHSTALAAALTPHKKKKDDTHAGIASPHLTEPSGSGWRLS
jgi:hypothetical protein